MKKRAYIAGIVTGLLLGGVGIGTAAATGRTFWMTTNQYAFYAQAGVLCHSASAHAIGADNPGMFCTASSGGWDTFVTRGGLTAMRNGHILKEWGTP